MDIEPVQRAVRFTDAEIERNEVLDDQKSPRSVNDSTPWGEPQDLEYIGKEEPNVTSSPLTSPFPPFHAPLTSGISRSQRPTGPARTPSGTYAPARRPTQQPPNVATERHRSGSLLRADPSASYRIQERAYVQRLRQDQQLEYFEPPTSSVSYGSDSEEASPAEASNDPFEQETLLFYGNDNIQPTEDDLKIPENRERLEWHGMLASVLTGDVVRQEKKRLIGASNKQGENIYSEIWLGLRAKTCGRLIVSQKRIIDEARSKLSAQLEEIISFEIKGESEVGKPPIVQVREIIKMIEKCDCLYPSRAALEIDNKLAASPAFYAACDAVISWHNITELINTQLGILKNWVGNSDLDFNRAKERSSLGDGLSDGSSFIDRLLKEDGLRSLQQDNCIFSAVSMVILKAKSTLISNSTVFAKRHLPPYIEELLILINFPSRLIEEIIKVRLQYAKNMKDPAQQNTIMQEQIISQFQILLNLAVRIKQENLTISHPEAGWELPPCIDDTFDQVVLDALKFYLKMLNWKLGSNKNTFKEAEVLEQEWNFSTEIGRHLQGGDVEVAEQFSSLTHKAFNRLYTTFERDLQRKPKESASDMTKRYKQSLDSVRVRQRMLQRFSRVLSDRFENATDFSISLKQSELDQLYENLIETGHFMVYTASIEHDGIFLIASPSLYNRQRDIKAILRTVNHSNETMEDVTNSYVLILRPETQIIWTGRKIEANIQEPAIDLKVGHLRLIAQGSQAKLRNARNVFLDSTDIDLDMVVEQRSYLKKVNMKLTEIKKVVYKLSNLIMDSVEIVRKQTKGMDCQELIQTCFVFATEFGQRSLPYMDRNRKQMNNLKLTKLGLDWVSFISDDCIATDRKTFRWAVLALEFAMIMTQGQHILALGKEEFARLRAKVAGCMSLLISHFDIMGARSTLAAQAEKQRVEALAGQFRKIDLSRMMDDEESARYVGEHRQRLLFELDNTRKQKEAERQALGRVMEESSEADRSLTHLSSSASNVNMRWQQGSFVGGGTFGSVYSAINLDSGQLMAVKEIRLQDPSLIPVIAGQIRDEMNVLEVLDHPNVVSYHGIEVHRDRVYIFMEFCSGGSLAGLLEHGRIEDEQVIMVYALQLLEGLAYLHESGIVHRDIKPENILLNHHGIIKYVDFGAAKVIARRGKTLVAINSTGMKADKSMTGTPMYMSPEVIKGEAPGRAGAVDIWSLGCVVLEMTTGRRPWAVLDNEWAIMYNIAQGNPPQLPAPDQLSPEGINFLKKCFIRDSRKRASASELLQHEWIINVKSQLSIGPGTPSELGSVTLSQSRSSVGSG
ncbi:BgTH12-02962 [Blumeria graminis f. sp. triticale]|uniref:MAP kinase kinase kinase n=3 Tax=Blumeria graminis TaxID=34373 RepID=A0A061HHR2_BLUGR|nr:MAP kinase kinase kinase of the HOG1 mitogen-activated signaling pathway [Blumeria graminis f. sp. tritici 96224]CAD6503295.1 BgTH12-02962 [Blumeria graminis f. sp. triticale]VDB89296.1 Bgt-1509 [Blumeria graminis f. sp. tritici]